MAAKFGGFSGGLAARIAGPRLAAPVLAAPLLAAMGAFFALLVLASPAHAAGSFKLKTTTAAETSGAWHIFVTVELPRAPATAHVPMKFLFTKEAVFERDLVDNHDGPVTNQMVLTNQTPSVESVDVDFADGSGKVFRGTRFDFSLSRDRGYEAGIYQVKVRTSDGLDIGGSQRLTLTGDNPVIDRRSITFNAKEKSVKKVPGYGLDGGANGAPSTDDSPSTQSTDVAPSGSADSFIPADAYNKTPEEEVKTRPSGCGCIVAGADGASGKGPWPGSARWHSGSPCSRRVGAEERESGEALAQARKGELLPLYVLVGEERFLRDQLVADIRAAALGGGIPAFNEDRFQAGEVDIDKVLSAARTVPMMAPKRFILVRGVERWDSARDAASDDDDDSKKSSATAPLDKLAAYAASPIDSTCVVLVAEKIDGRRKLMAIAKKQGFLVTCEALDDRALTAWIADRARAMGHAMERDVVELLAAIAGPELAYVNDAMERLSLYAGAGNAIDEAAVAECIARVRTADTWALVDAVGKRDLGEGLRILADVYDPRDRGLPLLGALAWSIRQLARFQAATAGGASPDEAARKAGVFQPFRARELASKARGFRPKEVERWLLVLSETDLALKSSRRQADAILEDMLTRMCGAVARRSA